MLNDAVDCQGVMALLEARAAEDERSAFVEGRTGARLSWTELRDTAADWSAWRSTAGLDAATQSPPSQAGSSGKTPRVGLLLADPLEMTRCYLAALANGVTAAPLNPAGMPAELGRHVETLGLSAVVVDQESEEMAQALGAAGAQTWYSHDGKLDLRAQASRRAPEVAENGAALVLSSSGTTGTPKIVPLSEAQLLGTAANVARAHRLTQADCGYCPLPLFHINALVVGVLSTLVTGGRMVLDRRFSAGSFWEVAGRHETTWLNLVPAIIAVLSSVSPPDPDLSSRVGFARSASAPLPQPTLERFEERCGITVIETYGMTEAASQIAANPRPPQERRVGSVGLPVGVEVRIVDKSRVPLGANTVGSVEIRGQVVVQRYWYPAGQCPSSRPATDADGWLTTGDLGKVDDDGYLYLVGRDDDVINRGGEKVYPREIEEVLLADADVKDAAVVGRVHPTVGEEPVAFVLAQPGVSHQDLVERLAARCAKELSRFKRPVEINVAQRLPVGPTGKVKRSELRRELAADSGGKLQGQAARGRL